VIGKKLAQRLNAGVGDKLVVFALPRGQANQPKAMQFQLVGVYESGMAEFDDIYAYTSLNNAQNLFQLGDDVTGYDVLVKDVVTVDEIAKQLQNLLGYPHYTRTVFQLYHNLFSWVELQKKMSPVLLSLIIIVATVNIIGTILMFVLEKIRAIGILKSLGASPKIIGKIFVLQGLGIATVGIFLGNALALTFCLVQMKFKFFTLPSEIYYMNSVPILIRPEHFVIVTLLAYVLCLMTTLLPSRAAARMNAVDALRFG
jgi:lipoprotein-releasing system permease protein